ncbi:MAG: hypothetical protein RQ885_15185 [Desulfurococcales archaeon]|nr:hypothetical protein [Desulfurococcales archaeon]
MINIYLKALEALYEACIPVKPRDPRVNMSTVPLGSTALRRSLPGHIAWDVE